MNRNILIAIAMLISLQATAQKIHQYVHAGFNIGALAPVSLPNTIRKIEGYSPLFSPSIGYEIVYQIKGKWGVGATLKLEYKGMRVKDSVQYFHTIITQQSSSGKSEFEGDFTGTNRTRAHNCYLTLPVNAVFQSSEKWRFKLGLYAAYLLAASFDGTVSNGYIRNGNSLGEKVIISEASFDFAKEERKFDWGLQGGAERKIGKKLAIAANLQWGLQPVFPSEFKGVGFKMYNIFAGLGVSYEL